MAAGAAVHRLLLDQGDRLADKDNNGEFGPYIEIMAGVYTDNQPDFSFLQPGETKTWSQYWYPIQKIGPAQHANLDAAICLVAAAATKRDTAFESACRDSPAHSKILHIGVRHGRIGANPSRGKMFAPPRPRAR